ncbi:hypothetical protein [Rhodococcus opacus]|uniref:hypothetical protein n=1 Tax=Rhodococcus opacus TaxID=37919 RepID=UPI00100998C0|nr:hypothetical protein [Rhodococcus opacus]
MGHRRQDEALAWVVGGSFAAAILFLGIAANQHENTPTASETALASRTSAAAATLSAQQAEAKRLEQEEIKRQHEEERLRRAAEAEAERQRQAEVLAAKMDRGTYEQIGDRDFALLAKDPDAHKGRKLVIYGVVTQFDSATGKTTFRAETGANPGDYYDYGPPPPRMWSRTTWSPCTSRSSAPISTTPRSSATPPYRSSSRTSSTSPGASSTTPGGPLPLAVGALAAARVADAVTPALDG